MTNTFHRLDNPVWTSLKEDIDLRRKYIDRLRFHLLLGRPLQIHKRIKNQRELNILIKREEDDRCRPLLHHYLHNQRMVGRYKRVKPASQVAELLIPLKPAEPVNITQSLQEIPINIPPQLQGNVLQAAKDSGSDSEAVVWSFDKAINEVNRFLPQNYAQTYPRERLPLYHYLG